MTSSHRTPRRRTGAAIALTFAAATLGLAGCSGSATAPPAHAGGGEANLSLPETLRDGSVTILGMNGLWPLYVGLVLCIFGLLFGVWTYSKLKALPAHESMKEISELIYTTCKAYLVKQGKFLMLLFVIETQLNDRGQRGRDFARAEQAEHQAVNVLTITPHLVERRAHKQSALRARILFANGLVVGIEQHAKGRIEMFVTGQGLFQHEGFKKPACVREVPFDGAGIGHGLHGAVFGGKRRAKLFGRLADHAVT